MRPSHNNGEDKPPIKLSTSKFDRDDKSTSNQPIPHEADSSFEGAHASPLSCPTLEASDNHQWPAVINQAPVEEHGILYDASSTDNSRNVITDRCTTSAQASSGVDKYDSANTQAPEQASAISKEAGLTTASYEEPSTPSEAIVKDDHTYPEGGLTAWLVVLGSFSGMVASFGILNTVGTFQAYLSTHQLAQHSPSSIGWIFSIFAFLTFFCGVQIGPVFDAKGPRWLVAIGSILLFAGMMGVAESTSMSINPISNFTIHRY